MEIIRECGCQTNRQCQCKYLLQFGSSCSSALPTCWFLWRCYNSTDDKCLLVWPMCRVIPRPWTKLHQPCLSVGGHLSERVRTHVTMWGMLQLCHFRGNHVTSECRGNHATQEQSCHFRVPFLKWETGLYWTRGLLGFFLGNAWALLRCSEFSWHI